MGAIGLNITSSNDMGRLLQCANVWQPRDIILTLPPLQFYAGEPILIANQLQGQLPSARIWLRSWDVNASSWNAKQFVNTYIRPYANSNFNLAVDNNVEWTRENIDWWADVANRATDLGVRLALPGFSNLEPGGEDKEILQALIAQSESLVFAIINGGHVLRLNESAGVFWPSGYLWDKQGYPAPTINAKPRRGTAWHCGRWTHWLKYFASRSNKPLHFLIGEHGFNTLDGDPDMFHFAQHVRAKIGNNIEWSPRAIEPLWREAFPNLSYDEVYGRSLIAMSESVYKHPAMLGQCVYSYADGDNRLRGHDVSRRERLWEIVGEYNQSLQEDESYEVQEPGFSPPPRVRSITVDSPVVEPQATPLGLWFWVGNNWQYNRGDYSNDFRGVGQAIRNTLQLGRGVELWIKIAEGNWNYGKHTDLDGFAFTDSNQLRYICDTLGELGVPVRLWSIPEGEDADWREEVRLVTELANNAGSNVRGLILDIEPYEQFWGSYRQVGRARDYSNMLRDSLNSNLDLWAAPDARGAKLRELRWEEWSPNVTAIMGQCYWNEFELPWRRAVEYVLKPMPTDIPRGLVFPWYKSRAGQQLKVSPSDLRDAMAAHQDKIISIWRLEGLTHLQALGEVLRG